MTAIRGGPEGGALEAIDEARDVGELEAAFLRAAPRLVDADAFGICLLDRSGRASSVRSIDVPWGLPVEYERFGRDNDALFDHISRAGEPVHEGVLFSGRAWRREAVSRFISEWGYERCMQAPVTVDRRLRATLHFTRGRGARPFGIRDLRAVALLSRCTARQLRCLTAEQELARAHELCVSLLASIPMPAAVTRAGGDLVHVNAAARELLVCHRIGAALWPAYAAAVQANVEAIVETQDDGHGRLAARDGEREPGYVVRTSRVGHGELYLSLFHPATRERGGGPDVLAAREQVVASLVAEGYTNERIAEALSVSVNTVKDHLKRIGRKLGTGNRAGVAAWAQANLPVAPSAADRDGRDQISRRARATRDRTPSLR